MKEKRNDFGWLVALLEEQKRDQNVRPRHMYTHQEQSTPEFQRWKKRKELKWVVYLLIIFLSVILPLILH
ncbi:MAG: hypothetical protein ACYC7D_15845 [Nitrososphaerales archaeon]